MPVSDTPAKPLKPEDLTLDGRQTFTWPMDPVTGTVRDGSRFNKVPLLRLDTEGVDPATKEHAADGVVAYSAVCVHTGWDVTEWHPDQQLLVCPYHYSTYDAKDGAKVVSGRPRAACRRCH